MNYDEFYNWVTVGYKEQINIQRTRDRIVKNNEVFTSLDNVLLGLEYYSEDDIKDINLSWCDGCCGEGAWLVGVALKRMKLGVPHNLAIQNLKGTDICADNIEATKIRLAGDNKSLLKLINNNFVACDGLLYHGRFDGTDANVSDSDLQLENLGFEFS